MNALKNYRTTKVDTHRLGEESILHCTINHESNTIFVATHTSLSCYNLENVSQVAGSLNLRSLQAYQQTDIKIVGFEYMVGEQQLCIALDNSDILLYDTLKSKDDSSAASNEESVECVGFLNCNLKSMHWSPDYELVLFITDDEKIICMTHDFDVITEKDISSKNFGENEMINVGWGKVETQFRGSAGKYNSSRQQTMAADVVDKDNGVKVCWRADGQFFVVSNVENGNRCFRVWNRECELQSTSEEVSGLESALAWKPTGALIALSQRKVNAHEIIFFEINGLRRHSFTLPVEKDQALVKKLEWSSDSKVLMIFLQDFVSSQCYIQLWSVANYHWALKKTLYFDNQVVLTKWDDENPLKLHVFLESGEYYAYTFSWSTSYSGDAPLPQDVSSVDSSYIAVIDGFTVNLTPFKDMTIPPPMFCYSLEFPEQVKEVAFCRSSSAFNNMIVLSNKCFHFLKNSNEENESVSGDVKFKDGTFSLSTLKSKGIATLSQTSSITLSKISDFCKNINILQMHHLTWVSQCLVLFIAPSLSCSSDVLVLVTLDESLENVVDVISHDMPCRVVNTCSSWSATENDIAPFVVLLLANGDVLNYDCKSKQYLPLTDLDDEPITFYRDVLEMRAFVPLNCDSNDDILLLTLTHDRKLYVDKHLISSECTSFALHNDYLLYTTSSHCLQCLPTSALTKKGASAIQDCVEVKRDLERGSAISIVTPSSTKLVLQLPRGNLEIIHPRALVLAVLRRLLSRSQYKEAFMIMRKNRIDMNFFCDFNPSKFADEIDLFVKQIRKTDFLNLFLSCLNKDDCSKTVYKNNDPLNAVATSDDDKVDDKVNFFCDLFLKEFEKYPVKDMLLPSITANARKNPRNLKGPLEHLNSLDISTDDGKKLRDSALKYMLVLVGEQDLYREALGTYNLDIVLTVAHASSNDPKEYYQFLNELKALDENTKRFRIDMHLKKYASALQHLMKCPGKFNECVELIKSKDIFRESLLLFKESGTPKEYQMISNLYADYLISNHMYKEAGLILRRASSHEKAVNCFIKSCQWQLAMSSAHLAGFSSGDIKQLVARLAERLAEKGSYLEAATVLEMYAHDYEKAVMTLLKGSHWTDALRVIDENNLPDLLPKLKCSMEENATHLSSMAESHHQQLKHYSDRLTVVREKKKENLLKEGESQTSDLESDVGSDFGSVMTSTTATSKRSCMTSMTRKSKSVRKEKKKRYSMREGSKFEEEGLLHAMHEIYTKVKVLADDVKLTITSLTAVSCDAEAKSLQTSYNDVVKSMVSLKNSIWGVPPEQSFDLITALSQNVQSFDDLKVFVPPEFDAKLCTKYHLHS